jgi:hypothetical protein
MNSLNGGAERDRTVDLLNAIQALSQLSYSPTALSLTESNIEGKRLSIFLEHLSFATAVFLPLDGGGWRWG